MHYTYRNAMRDRKTHGLFEVTFDEDGIRVYIFFETPTPQGRRAITIWILNERKQGHEGSSFFSSYYYTRKVFTREMRMDR